MQQVKLIKKNLYSYIHICTHQLDILKGDWQLLLQYTANIGQRTLNNWYKITIPTSRIIKIVILYLRRKQHLCFSKRDELNI